MCAIHLNCSYQTAREVRSHAERPDFGFRALVGSWKCAVFIRARSSGQGRAYEEQAGLVHEGERRKSWSKKAMRGPAAPAGRFGIILFYCCVILTAAVILFAMNITLIQKRSQVIAALALTVCCAGGMASAETHSNFQAVTSSGVSAWSGGSAPFDPVVTLTGVLLCGPEEMLDPTPNFIPYNSGANKGKMGGEWQVFFQAVEPGDRGGTACYMAQNYGNGYVPPFGDDNSYSNAAWTAEILRLNYDANTMRAFQPGDLVEVTARQALFYGGKLNINEGHDVDPAYNFDIRLLTANYGLPSPEVVTLAELKQADNSYIFDPTRATGGEHWQGMRVRLNNLTLVSSNGWNPTNAWGARLCTATDGTGRTFPLRTPRYSLGSVPSSAFDAIGVLNQESGSGSQGTNGYELFVQQVIPQAPPALGIAQKLALTWPVSGAAYQLEYRNDLNSTNWYSFTNSTPVVVDGQLTVLVAPESNAQQFYRLRKTN